jgi:uncharacterized membrane protein YbhN (UPF0104 family)
LVLFVIKRRSVILINISKIILLESIKTKKISFWIKSLIFLIVALVLYYVLSRNEKLDEIYLSKIKEGWETHAGFLLVAIFLIPVNWSLEAFKWKFLIEKLERISFRRALEGVIAGVTMGFVTPHSIGDYAARIFCLTNEDRLKGIGAVFISRISQFYITLYLGMISLGIYSINSMRHIKIDTDWVIGYTFASGILFVSVVPFILIFIFYKKILKYFRTKNFLGKLMPYIEIIETYSSKEINFVLLLSLLRYMVFCIQFILVLLYFNIGLSWWVMFTGVTFIFFVKSVVPTFLDLGVRETAAVIFFGEFINDDQNIIFASLTLWLLNIVFPAILGLPLVYRMKLFNKERN